MAATVSAWGKAGAWALDSEENEAELLQQHNKDSSLDNGGDAAEFPSLAAAATTTKTKKKKPQALSLQEFSAYGGPKPAASQQKGLTPDELLLLPTGPRQRSPEELDRNKLGGGFRSYGGGARDEQPRRQGSFNRESNREFATSRADETDDWGAGKKFSGNNGSDRRRGEKEGVSSLIHNREQMRWTIGRRKRVLFPLSPGDMKKEEDLDWNRVMVGQTR
ncbi:UNVERIFIED_CONTAM: Eukaryotic translation initiation factor 4B3 [Sesamum radiatum]|uniref:Eukaryotic translation initiation factor 4B3 n=1 Tax=Sesamum radiatum TaxID=300843 RepID=A0AAW2U677_SESRA